MKLECKFGKPHDGWLPVSLNAGGFSLEIDVSDVPVDPIYVLISSLYRALSGLDSEVWWHLEPASYYFYFEPEETGELKFTIAFAEENVTRNHREIVFETSGSKAEIILPLWRAIQEFVSYSYKEPDWPLLSSQQKVFVNKNLSA
ncbi:MAG: hypothetical protein IPM53_21155 [Anaerolineaceae bacterium]|nr:hypothetical protein [Anaerolineaceae bacterium]